MLLSYGIAVIAIKIFAHQYDFAFAGRIAMSVMLLFTAIGHFVFPKGMAMMLPGFIPIPVMLVYITGIYAAAKHIDYQTGKDDGKGFNYLLFRVPLQILFIIWTWMSTR